MRVKVANTFAILFSGFLVSPLVVWAGSNGFHLSSTAFEDNAAMPAKYTCEGGVVHPPLVFKNVPAKAKSLALTVTDPDAPEGVWTHWVIYNMPSDIRYIIGN